jgi:hypothetical protein
MGNPQIRAVLAKVTGVDFGYDSAKWEAWWLKNRNRVSDE